MFVDNGGGGGKFGNEGGGGGGGREPRDGGGGGGGGRFPRDGGGGKLGIPVLLLPAPVLPIFFSSISRALLNPSEFPLISSFLIVTY